MRVSKQHEYYKNVWRYAILAKYRSNYIDIKVSSSVSVSHNKLRATV